MLFIIGVMAFAAALAVFALPFVVIALVVTNSRRRRANSNSGGPPANRDTDIAFTELVRRGWPDTPAA